ncbi:5-formyltetrahydrofolate cyclo-ligase [Ferrimonas gelatinilytica]|uniref:5-formyltetrahydrofolate cyclo-ligase n=1 Tax=Ferrimonas gelatinilytica TaxID=1255257 RepID=A0ABP9S6B8_9GAMM
MTPSRDELRQQLRTARRQLSHDQQKHAAIALASHLPDHSLLQHASQVALYMAADGEIDPHILAEVLFARGKQIALPVMHPFNDHQLLFQRYEPGQPLLPNRYGIPEPQLAKPELIPLQELDVVLMPLVGFDDNGNRLGMGGGFYDRTLGGVEADLRPTLIGLAHSCQRVEKLYAAHWDVPLNGIATEQGLHWVER